MNGLLPCISIVTVNLNSGATLERTIKSVLGQDYQALEYIVIDGGSRDDSLEILERYRQGIDILVSEPDRGISDAFNKGIALAKGEIIGLISADDVLENGALQAVGEFYHEQGKPDVIYGDAFYLERGQTVRVRPDPLHRFGRHMPLRHPAVYVRRQTHDLLGQYDPHYRFAMDYDLLLRFYRGGARFCYLERPLAIITAGGLNQRHLPHTIREVREISIRHGTARPAAYAFYGIKLAKMLMRRGLGLTGLNVLIVWYRQISKRYSP